VLILGPDGGRARISGAGALVWMVLDAPAGPSEIRLRIERRWPDLGTVDEATTAQAIEALVAAGVVTCGPAP
jgi:hypothetical protein